MKVYPSQELLKRLLSYDPVTGLWVWLERTPDMFDAHSRAGRGEISAEMACKIWNNKFAGKLAGSIEKAGYRIIRIGKYQYKAHILAVIFVTGFKPILFTDHEDLDRANNIYSNLRDATRSENNTNVGPRKNNKLGVKGVRQHGKRFEARITKDKIVYQLGTFDTLEGATDAVSKAALKLHGEFARTT